MDDQGDADPARPCLLLAERRNLIPENPIRRLQPEELPKGVAKDPPRVLTRDEIAALLAAAPPATSRSSGRRPRRPPAAGSPRPTLVPNRLQERHDQRPAPADKGPERRARPSGEAEDEGRQPRRGHAARPLAPPPAASAHGRGGSASEYPGGSKPGIAAFHNAGSRSRPGAPPSCGSSPVPHSTLRHIPRADSTQIDCRSSMRLRLGANPVRGSRLLSPTGCLWPARVGVRRDGRGGWEVVRLAPRCVEPDRLQLGGDRQPIRVVQHRE